MERGVVGNWKEWAKERKMLLIVSSRIYSGHLEFIRSFKCQKVGQDHTQKVVWKCYLIPDPVELYKGIFLQREQEFWDLVF